MNIELDEKELRNLLDIAHIADVVMSGHRKSEDRRTSQHRALIQKIYGIAKDAGLDPLVRVNDSLNKLVPTPEFEQSTIAHVVLDEFGDHLFWDHLINRLTERDTALLVGGIDTLRTMGAEERKNLEAAIRRRYAEEFTMNDIANLTLIERFDAAGTSSVKTSD